MIPIFHLKGYKHADPLDALSKKSRTILHMSVCSIITILLLVLIGPVFKIVFFKCLAWQIAEVIMFGGLYAYIIVNTRKASSLFHYLIILIPLFITDIFLETHGARSLNDPSIWNYYPDSFVFNIQPIGLRFLVTLSLDGLLMGPVCLWISRIIASFLAKKQTNHFDESYFKLFNEERTSDPPLALPKRILLKQQGKKCFAGIDFDFWILRILGLFFLAYLSILVLGVLGWISLSSQETIWPELLSNLISDTYANPFHHVHSIGKISNFILLAMIAAFHAGVRFIALRIFLLGNLVAALCSFYLYFFSSGEDFLLQSGIVDSLATIVGLVLYLRSKKVFDKNTFGKTLASKDATIAEQILQCIYLVGCIMFSILFIMLFVGFIWGPGDNGFIGKWYQLIKSPESMLLNSVTFAFTSSLIAYYCYRYKGLRSVFTHNLTDPLIFSAIAGLFWLVHFYLNSEVVQSPLKAYLLIYLLSCFALIMILRKARTLYYNMDLQITTLHPSEADTAHATVTAIYGDDQVNALAAVKKVDKFIASIKGRKRGLINFPFFILENILSPLLALRPRFSNMSLEERCYFLKKYILRTPAQIRLACLPELAIAANKIGISLKAIASLSYLSTAEGRSFVGYIEPERRDRYATSTQFGSPPFMQVPPLPFDENDPFNFRPSVNIPADTLPANHLSSSRADAPHGNDYDYVIVGSGASGAVMAYRLASCHRIDPSKILLIERGSRLSRHTDMNDDEMDMLAKLYKEGGLQQTKKFDMVVLQGEALGGTTVINNAVCLEMPPAMQTIWENAYGIPLGKIHKHYLQIKREINIHTLHPNAINQHVANKFRKAVVAFIQKHGNVLQLEDPLMVNARCEDGDGLWNVGNKRGKKLSMESTYIPWAESKGIHVLTQTDALKFSSEEVSVAVQGKKKASGILVQTPLGMETIAINKALIVCCGCIASTHLLMRSLDGNHNNMALGKNLACNYAFPFAFTFDDELKAYDGTQITLAALHKSDDYIFETYFNPPAAFSITIPFNFETHREVLKNYAHCLNFGILLGSSNIGRIDRKYDRLTGRAFEFNLADSGDLIKIKKAMRAMVELGKLAGARSVVIPLNPGIHVDLSNQHSYQSFLEDFDAYELKQSDLILSTAHPQGGNAMSGNPNIEGVVGTDFKLKGYDNVYVTDASVFPTSIGVNPQWTIMAMSSMAADQICEDYQ